MSRGRDIARFLGKLVLVLVVGVIAYAGLGWLALGVMYDVYGGSGHPPAPAAPSEVYVGVFLVALPVLGLLIGGGGLWLGTYLVRKMRRSGSRQRLE